MESETRCIERTGEPRREKDGKRFREHVRRCSREGRPVVAGINTAFNVGRRRSWARGPQGASLLVAPASVPPRRASFRLSLPVIAPDPTPRPPPTEGSLLFLRSAIRQIAIDTDDPLLFFFFSPFSPNPSAPHLSFSRRRSFSCFLSSVRSSSF